MKCCKECEHSVYDEKWGEYKCELVQHRVYEPDRYVACRNYRKKKTEKLCKTDETDVENS